MITYNDWIERARSAFLAASNMPTIKGLLYEDYCYQAQQAVEKALKGLILLKKHFIIIKLQNLWI